MCCTHHEYAAVSIGMHRLLGDEVDSSNISRPTTQFDTTAIQDFILSKSQVAHGHIILAQRRDILHYRLWHEARILSLFSQH